MLYFVLYFGNIDILRKSLMFDICLLDFGDSWVVADGAAGICQHKMLSPLWGPPSPPLYCEDPQCFILTKKELADLPEVQIFPQPVRTHSTAVQMELAESEQVRKGIFSIFSTFIILFFKSKSLKKEIFLNLP